MSSEDFVWKFSNIWKVSATSLYKFELFSFSLMKDFDKYSSNLEFQFFYFKKTNKKLNFVIDLFKFEQKIIS